MWFWFKTRLIPRKVKSKLISISNTLNKDVVLVKIDDKYYTQKNKWRWSEKGVMAVLLTAVIIQISGAPLRFKKLRQFNIYMGKMILIKVHWYSDRNENSGTLDY